jgi:hypothetical protein
MRVFPTHHHELELAPRVTPADLTALPVATELFPTHHHQHEVTPVDYVLQPAGLQGFDLGSPVARPLPPAEEGEGEGEGGRPDDTSTTITTTDLAPLPGAPPLSEPSHQEENGDDDDDGDGDAGGGDGAGAGGLSVKEEALGVGLEAFHLATTIGSQTQGEMKVRPSAGSGGGERGLTDGYRIAGGRVSIRWLQMHICQQRRGGLITTFFLLTVVSGIKRGNPDQRSPRLCLFRQPQTTRPVFPRGNHKDLKEAATAVLQVRTLAWL